MAQDVVINAWMRGNKLACINDARIDPLDPSCGQLASYNAAICEVLIAGLPFAFVTATQDILEGEQILEVPAAKACHACWKVEAAVQDLFALHLSRHL